MRVGWGRALQAAAAALLVADPYFGLLKVNTATGGVAVVVAAGAHSNLTLPNDLDVTADGATAFFSNTGRLSLQPLRAGSPCGLCGA